MLFLCLAICAPAAAQPQSNPFLEAGIPAVDHEWLGTDYERAVQILSTGKVALPRLADPRGAALLRRMTSTTSFAFHRNRSLPLEDRMGDFLKLYQATSSLLKLYLAEPEVGSGPHQEIAAVVAFLLQGSALGVELTEEFLPSIPKDEDYAARMAGLKQMNSGLTTVFVGAEQALRDRQNLSADDLSVILEAMASTLPRLKKAFSPEHQIELRKKLEEDRAEFSKPEDAGRLSSMIHELSV
jgi:hypothetical protein